MFVSEEALDESVTERFHFPQNLARGRSGEGGLGVGFTTVPADSAAGGLLNPEKQGSSDSRSCPQMQRVLARISCLEGKVVGTTSFTD